MNQAKCTTCGAGLTIKKGDKTCVCEYCQSTNIVENALALGKVEVDVTEDIKKLRENLKTFVQQNSIDEILRVSQKLLDWIPQDFVALYFFGYAKQQQNQPRFLYDFYSKPSSHTEDELSLVLEHLRRYSELRDKRRIIDFLNVVAPEFVSQYNSVHKEREDQEDHYANIPRDVFVCFSSFDVEVAKAVVDELEADGNTCWISTRNLRPEDAENYWKNIENAIQNSALFLVVSSADSMRSKDVHQEVELAQKYQKRLIEFKVDDRPHNTLFKHVFDGNKWVKGSKETKQSYKGLLQRVYEEKSLPVDSIESSLLRTITRRPNKVLLGSLISVFVVAVIAFFVFSNNGVELTLNGSPSIILSAGDRYNEFGAQALTSRNEIIPVEIIGNVDAMTPGTYTILYRATDDRGNVFETERIVQVIDTTPPELQMIGSENKSLLLGDEFTDPGVTAIDNVDGVVDVTTRGQVNTSEAGAYRIEYNAIDQAGNRSITLIRTVLVRIPTIDDLLARAFTVITIDINPTIAIFLDSTDRVVGVLPLNADAENVLTDYSYVNQNVDQVIDAIISRSEEYLNEEEVILIGVQSSSESKQVTIATRVERRVEQISQARPQTIMPVIRTMELNPTELRPVLRQEVPTQARQDIVQELIEVGRVNENANAIINRPIREIEAQRVEARVDEILNDTVPPRIRLQGNPNQNISLNGTYVEFGATVEDNLEDDLQVIITGTVDTSRAGVYELTYTARDSAGNEATPVIRRVTVGAAPTTPPPSSNGGSSGSVTPPTSGGSSGSVTPPTTPGGSSNVTPPNNQTPPSIQLVGSSSLTLNVGDLYEELGATATDRNGKSINVVVSGSVNTNQQGTYTITYTATDESGVQAVPVTRVINVIQPNATPPVITLNGNASMRHLVGRPFVDPGATAVDASGRFLNPTITGTVNVNQLGTYEIRYVVLDFDGNRSEKVRTVNVVEGTRVTLYEEFIEARITSQGPITRNRNITNFSLPEHSYLANIELVNIYITAYLHGSYWGPTYPSSIARFSIDDQQFFSGRCDVRPDPTDRLDPNCLAFMDIDILNLINNLEDFRLTFYSNASGSRGATVKIEYLYFDGTE
jgi:hypothetical protein